MDSTTEASYERVETEEPMDQSDSNVVGFGITEQGFSIVSLCSTFNYVFMESIQF